MKFHFGHIILISFILFGALIGTLVYKSLQTEFELVSDDYYKQEITYQEIIDASKNADHLTSLPEIVQNQSQLFLTMPQEFIGKEISGEIYFYCPSDSKKDRKIKMQLSSNGSQQLNAKTNISPANYIVRINWNFLDKPYFREAQIRVN